MTIKTLVQKRWRDEGVKFKIKPLRWIRELRTANCAICGKKEIEESVEKGFPHWTVLLDAGSLDKEGKAPEICPLCRKQFALDFTSRPLRSIKCVRCGVQEVEKIFGIGFPGWIGLHNLCPNCALNLAEKLGPQFNRQTWTSLTYATNSLLTSTKMTQNQANFQATAQGHSGAPAIYRAVAWTLLDNAYADTDLGFFLVGKGLELTNLGISVVKIYAATAPTGASLIVDVNINGTTIFATQSNRPEIAIAGNSDDSGTPNTTTVSEGDRLSFDVDQIGSTIAGGNPLLITVIFE